MIRLLLSFFLLLTFNVKAYDYQLSIAAIFQDEARFLREWIEYHHLVGVNHFYLYNNNSTDNYKEVLQPYIDIDLVELIEWPSDQSSIPTEKKRNHFIFETQCGAFNDALARSRHKTKWLALLDSDEYIVPTIHNTITECLEDHFSQKAGVCAYWKCFGTSYYEKVQPNEWMIEKLFLSMSNTEYYNTYFKCIVKPEFVRTCPNPHICIYLPGYDHVKTNGNPVPIHQIHDDPCWDLLYINHYWTRDEDHFRNVKIPRQERWGQACVDQAYILYNLMNVEEDYTIQRFLPALKEKCLFKIPNEQNGKVD